MPRIDETPPPAEDADLPSTLARDTEVAAAITAHEAAVDPHGGYVKEAVYDANSLVIADSDNTPIVLAVAASTFVGRKASGGIAAMSVAEARTVLGLATSSTVAFSALAVGSNPAETGDIRLPHGGGINAHNSANDTDRAILGFGILVNDEFFVGSNAAFTHMRSNLAAASSPSNGDWWVEVTGVSPARIAALKVRDGGVTRTIASVTF